MLGCCCDEKCVCGNVVRYNYGICNMYKDKDGQFNYDEDNVCDKCGHIINSERIHQAILIGVIYN